jgi:transcriptional regulator GlxA family with amidase domain
MNTEFITFEEKCIAIVEDHMDDYNFSVTMLAREMGMSHSALYKKLKSVSGQPVTAFIRSIRLRKAAEIMINSGHNINEVATIVGFSNIKFFRQYFNESFGMKPSEYIKHYRKPYQTRQAMKNIV